MRRLLSRDPRRNEGRAPGPSRVLADGWGGEYRRAVPFPRRLLSEGEDLVLDLRPHWIALAAPAFETVLILAGLVLALVYIPDSWPSWTRVAIAVAALVLFLVYPAPRIVRRLTSHFVVTSDRLIHRSGWLSKRSMEIPLEKISDVRFHQGVFERVIGAGDLTLESAGEFGQQTFSHIPDPEHVQKVIYDMGETNQRRMMTPAAAPAMSVADELTKLERLRTDGVLSEDEFQSEKARLLRRD